MSLTRVYHVLKAKVERTVMAMVVLGLALGLALALTLAVIRGPVAEVAVHVALGIVMVRAHSGVLRNFEEVRGAREMSSTSESECRKKCHFGGYSHQCVVSFHLVAQKEEKTRRCDGGVKLKVVGKSSTVRQDNPTVDGSSEDGTG